MNGLPAGRVAISPRARSLAVTCLTQRADCCGIISSLVTKLRFIYVPSSCAKGRGIT